MTHRLATWVLTGGLLIYAAQADAAASDREIQMMVHGLDCAGCAKEARKALKKVHGVKKVNVDFKTKAAVVIAAEDVTPDSLKRALLTLGFEGVLADETRPDLEPLPKEVREGLDIRTVSNGEVVQEEGLRVPGKFVVVDYFAEWCGPCHLLDAKLQHLLTRRPDVAVRRINLPSWDSPAARWITERYGVPGLPYARVLGPDGKFLGEAHGNDLPAIEKLLAPQEEAR